MTKLAACACLAFVGSLGGIGLCVGAEPATAATEFGNRWKQALDTGDVAAARSLCEAARSAPASRVEALVCLANIEFKEARRSAVEVDLAALGMQPGESRAVGPEALEKGFKDVPLWDDALVDKALAHLEEAIGLEPARGDLWLGKAHLLRSTGRRAELNRHLARAARDWPGATPQALAAYGREYFESGDVEAAAEVLEALAMVYPDDFEVCSDAGAANAAAGRYEHALELLAKAEKLGDDDLLLINIANVNIRLERIDIALPYLKRMYDRHPDNPPDQLRFILAAAAVKGDDARSSIEHVKHAAGTGVDTIWEAAMTHMDADLALAVAQQMYESQDHDLALLGVANAKTSPRSLFLRAGIYEALGRQERAVADLEAYLAAATEADRAVVPLAESNLGLAFMRLARPKDAVPHLTRAIALGVADSGVYDALGHAHLRLGHDAEALAAFDQSVKVNTDSDVVERSRLSAARLRKEATAGPKPQTEGP